jgi:cytochrome c-type biogenesis protein CcmH/NrfG
MLNNFADAKKALEKALEIEPNNAELLKKKKLLLEK